LADASAAIVSAAMVRDIGLSFSGSFSVMVATDASTSYRMAS
jgi:hypothetical protein